MSIFLRIDDIHGEELKGAIWNGHNVREFMRLFCMPQKHAPIQCILHNTYMKEENTKNTKIRKKYKRYRTNYRKSTKLALRIIENKQVFLLSVGDAIIQQKNGKFIKCSEGCVKERYINISCIC